MRKINTRSFRRGTRTTPREINRQIVLNLVREHQPVSRADLARLMQVSRGMVSLLVDDLLEEGSIYEGATANAPRGRKPKLLHVRTRDRILVGVDVRAHRTHVMLSDFEGRHLSVEAFETLHVPEELVAELAGRIQRLLRVHGVESCEGIGLVVPGMVDRRTGWVLNAPQIGWRNVPLRQALSEATNLPVYIENAPIACALAQLWNDGSAADNFVYVAVGDGVGAGVVVNGEVLRGYGHTAGEFGHIPLNVEGPHCMCGRRGCLEAYTSNFATLARYFDLDLSRPEHRQRLMEGRFTLSDLVTRARAGDANALHALRETGRYLGMGLAGIINAVSPQRILIGGEIAASWDLVADLVREGVRERTLTDAAAATPVTPVLTDQFLRLRGAVALLVARTFAAPKVA